MSSRELEWGGSEREEQQLQQQEEKHDFNAKLCLSNFENMENNSENGVEEATPETGVKHEEGMIVEEKPFDKD